jgi:hypothetical protein
MQIRMARAAFGVTLAIAVCAQAQSNRPAVPSSPPDITLSCQYGALGTLAGTAAVQIWTSAHTLKWSPTGSRSLIFSAEAGPVQISFGGDGAYASPAGVKSKVTGAIDRLTGRMSYEDNHFPMSGICVQAKPKF